MVSLKPLDATRPSHFADLPGELMQNVVRAAVQKETPIDIRRIDEEIAPLLAPFQGLPMLLGIAEQQAMRVNVFSASFIRPDLDVGRSFDCTKDEYRYFLETEELGEISRRAREIRHIQVEMRIRVRGTTLDEHRRVAYDTSCVTFHRFLPRLFPRLVSLDVVVSNPAYVPRVGASGHAPMHKGYTIHGTLIRPQDPQFEELVKWEQMKEMELILVLVASVKTTAPLAKRVIFLQSEESADKPLVVDGQIYDSVPPPGLSRETADASSPSSLHRIREAAMFCAMRGWPPQSVKGLDSFRFCIKYMSRPELHHLHQICWDDIGTGDLEVVKQALSAPRAVVKLPCGASPAAWLPLVEE